MSVQKSFGLYFLASGAAALVNFGSRFFYDQFVSFGVSVVAAYCTGMLVNFSLSKLFVFDVRGSGRTWRELIKFLFVASVGLVVTYGVSISAVWVLEHWNPLSFNADLRYAGAHASGMAAGFAANFVGHKLVSFRETGLWSAYEKRKSE